MNIFWGIIFGLRCWLVHYRTSCKGEVKPSTGVFQYSKNLMYGSVLLLTNFDMILLLVLYFFSTKPLDLGCMGLDILCYIPQDSVKSSILCDDS